MSVLRAALCAHWLTPAEMVELGRLPGQALTVLEQVYWHTHKAQFQPSQKQPVLSLIGAKSSQFSVASLFTAPS